MTMSDLGAGAARPVATETDRRPAVLVVSVDSTTGWSAAARELTAALTQAGADVRLVGTGPVPRVRTFALTDACQAWLARRTARVAIAERRPDAIVYCSVTAALLWPEPGAIWLDSIAAENRPGRHGLWQRPVERRRLAQAPLVMAMSPHALDALVGPAPVTAFVPCPIAIPGRPPSGPREVLALAYAGNPVKKRLDFILDSWARVRRPAETLVVAGIDRDDRIDGVQFAGRLSPEDYRALQRRARAFVAAPQREDYGIAPLEALADGCQLVTTPAPGPYPARDLARTLDPRLVDEDIGRALRTALDDPLPGYAERAQELLTPFGHDAVAQTLRRDVLPTLIAS
jgi:hypothetical protein